MLHRALQRKVVVGALAVTLITALLGMGSVSADITVIPAQPQGYPTFIDNVDPYEQVIHGDPVTYEATAHWTVYLSGGDGTYYLSVGWGTGFGDSFWVYGPTWSGDQPYSAGVHHYAWQVLDREQYRGRI